MEPFTLDDRLIVGAYLNNYLTDVDEGMLKPVFDKCSFCDYGTCISEFNEYWNRFGQSGLNALRARFEAHYKLNRNKLNDVIDSCSKVLGSIADDTDYRRLEPLGLYDNEDISITSSLDMFEVPNKYYKVNNGLHDCFELDGFSSSGLYIIGGYTGSGKSLLALQLCTNLIDCDNCAYFSLENSNNETYRRLKELHNTNKFDIIQGRCNIDQVISTIKRKKYEFVVIDQLSMLDINIKADDIRIEYKKICQSLAELAQAQDIVIVLVCQLNRGYIANVRSDKNNESEWRQKFANLNDDVFAESSDITRPAQSAVIVSTHLDQEDGSHKLWIVNVKQRSGNKIKCKYYNMNGIILDKGVIYGNH